MGLRNWWRRLTAEPIKEWSVEYDRGGRVYTYRRTERAFREMLRDRAATGREAPYRVTVLVDGQPVKVETEERNDG